jgi:prevent-host-death family protein
MNIGVRELKQNLSEYLDRAANGELVVVTDRGIPKALIMAIPGGDQMSLGVEEGWITPPSRTGRLNTPLQLRSQRRSVDVINEDRGE